MSDMLKHLIMFYKYGGKQLYYFNTYDGSGEIDVDRMNKSVTITAPDLVAQADDACEACTI
jgi:hypothetical protein